MINEETHDWSNSIEQTTVKGSATGGKSMSYPIPKIQGIILEEEAARVKEPEFRDTMGKQSLLNTAGLLLS